MNRTKRRDSIKVLVRRSSKARIRLMDAILYEVERVAKRRKLDSVVFNGDVSILRNGEPVDVPRIRRMNNIFKEEIYPDGLIGIWTKTEGWRPLE